MLRKFQFPFKDLKSGQPIGDVAGVAFGDGETNVDLMFLHANGFNGMTYQSILQPLGAKMHVVAADLRGHGATTLPADPRKLKSWNTFRDDMIQVIARVAPEGLVLAGHSLGATTSLLIAAEAPHLVKGLVLVDPVLLPPMLIKHAHVPLLRSVYTNSAAKKARDRKSTAFSSLEAAEAHFRGRGAFKTWREPFLRDYLVEGLTYGPGEAPYTLACDPKWEAACFMAQANRPWSAFAQIGRYRKRDLAYRARLDEVTAPEVADIRMRKLAFDQACRGEIDVKKSEVAKTIPVIVLFGGKGLHVLW